MRSRSKFYNLILISFFFMDAINFGSLFKSSNAQLKQGSLWESLDLYRTWSAIRNSKVIGYGMSKRDCKTLI